MLLFQCSSQRHKAVKRRQSEPVIGWVTVTYRSVLMLIVGAVLVACVAAFFTFPQQSHVAMDRAQSLISKLVDRISGATQTVNNDERGEQQANFTALEGNVRVKKHSGNTWTAANFNLPLDKGDVVQTTCLRFTVAGIADAGSF